MLRTHNCVELRKKDIGKKAELCGWVSTRRDHGGVIFIDLRDRYGITQVVFNPDKSFFKEAEHFRREDVISVKGKVVARKKDMENKNLPTGEIEVVVEELDVISKADVPPIEIEDRVEANEDTRLKYRYLDLRRPKMINNLVFRHKVAQAAREFFNNNGFIDIETPILVRATPEGARDYIVPSRTNPGKFFALPQSPQLYKQILMISGVDRYYQFARCLRDEDLRQDRQPEHTQMDFEMSFVDEKDIIEFTSDLYKYIFKNILKKDIGKIPILTYKESKDRYGTDKPDLRFGLELIDVTDIVKDSDFEVFKNVIKNGGIVKCINPTDMPRKEIDDLIDFCTKNAAKGMAWMRVGKQGLESNIVKFFNKDIQKRLLEKTKAKQGSVLMFIADEKEKTNEILSLLRLELGKRLKLIKDEFKFCWIVDYPLFKWNSDEDRWEPEHHMFTSPKKEYIKDLEKDPGKVIGNLFDIVLNGVELGSGSIRVHDPEIQKRIMKIIGLSEKEAEKKFGFLLEAYKYGAPVHGGMGLGFDRLVAMMLGTNDIREVIAFPKNKNAENPMDSCPNEVPDEQLKELNIKSTFVKKSSK
ncbi:MAG: aspartate--tRNA ligase [Nanoarchaeota archaeon]|nr:aspartate--tRNA ligase [Nanoarchaeota archaeon]